jgi:hypothetical protein
MADSRERNRAKNPPDRRHFASLPGLADSA